MSKPKPKPKSQSEQADERRKRAKEARLERAGTAVLDGNPKKAAKIIDAGKKKEAKKPSPAQAVEILSAAHTLEMQITALDHKIDGIKEEYKELKAKREVLFGQLRMEVRDMNQGRLPFQSGVDAGGKPGAAPAPAAGKGKDGAPETKDPIEAELEGKAPSDELGGVDETGKDKPLDDTKRNPEPKKKAEGKAA